MECMPNSPEIQASIYRTVVVVEVLHQCSYQRWWLSEWVTPGGTAIPGMTSLKGGDLQHSSALALSPKGDVEPNHPSSEINPNSDSSSRSDGRLRRYVQYRVDQSQVQRPRSLLSLYRTVSVVIGYICHAFHTASCQLGDLHKWLYTWKPNCDGNVFMFVDWRACNQQDSTAYAQIHKIAKFYPMLPYVVMYVACSATVFSV